MTKCKIVKIALLSLSVLSLFVNFAGCAMPEKLPQISQQDLQKIEAAMPAKPTVTPAKPRKILVFWRCDGFFHKSIPTANKTFEIMGKKTGAFETIVSNDIKMFEPDKLKQFDAVLFNNSTGLNFENPLHRTALMDFVRNGKGIIGIHAATDCFYDWPEATQMMGSLFDNHPWSARGTWAVKLDEPNHPLNCAFNGKGFLISDEIYQLKAPYSRTKLRVLISLDMADKRNTDLTGVRFGDPHRKDNDYAISWVREFGAGRVFYCSLGHNKAIFWNPVILQHYLDGIQFALGDLPADAHRSPRKNSPKTTEIGRNNIGDTKERVENDD